MTSATRGIGKAVHSPDQAAFCELMIRARAAAGLTQQALALRLKNQSRLSPTMTAGASARRRGIRHDRSRFRCEPAQVDDNPFERWQGQIPSAKSGAKRDI